MKVLISPDFGAFRSGEPKAYRIAKRALEVGLDAVDEYVHIENNKIYVWLNEGDDPFLFEWEEI